MVPYLIITEGSNVGSTYLLGARTLIGRDRDNDIRLSEHQVSRRHALILKGPDGIFRIGDLSSTNGTYVCGYRVSGCRLSMGETIRIGESKFLFLQAASLLDIVDGSILDEMRAVSGSGGALLRRDPAQWARQVRKGHSFQKKPARSSAELGRQSQRKQITLQVEDEFAWWQNKGAEALRLSAS